MTRQELLDNGYQIDSTCYPNLAYKGERFDPIEPKIVPTEKEEQLAARIVDLESELQRITESVAND